MQIIAPAAATTPNAPARCEYHYLPGRVVGILQLDDCEWTVRDLEAGEEIGTATDLGEARQMVQG